MSDAPQGPGWWQANDQRWYPPAEPPQPPQPTPRPAREGNPFIRFLTRPLPLWTAVIALILGIALGAASAPAEDDDTAAELEDIRATLEDANETIRGAEQRADDAAAERDRMEGRLAAAEAAATRAAVDAEVAIADRQAQLDQREADLAAREQQLAAATAGLQASQFSDGIYMVGRDIVAGTYHTDGSGSTCYWAKLGPDGQDIIDNNNVDGPVTVIINSAFFESQRCGTWTKVD